MLFLFSCAEDPLVIDVSKVEVDLKLKRFDQDLFKYEKITDKELAEIRQKYTPFYEAFVENIISVGAANDPSNYFYLTSFIGDKNIQDVQLKSDSLYKDFSGHYNQLLDAFKHYKHYFPSKPTPEIITYNSGFNYAIVTDSSYLGIGLEMFLDENYPAYKQLGLPMYKIQSMTSKHLASSAMLGWLSTEFELNNPSADLLAEMIHQGKLLYAVDAMMPLEDDFLKISYTKEQWDWCNANEKAMWFFLIDNDLLYTKETQQIIKYMGESPFIQGFPEGSPGRVGHWLGWQVVKAFMENNPTVSLKELMKKDDAQKILNKSKYKP